MNLEVLTSKQKDNFLAVQNYKRENPETSNAAAFKALNINPSTYGFALKKLKDAGVEINNKTKIKKTRKYVKRAKMLTLPVDETPTMGSVVAFVGNPSEVVRAIKELRGH